MADKVLDTQAPAPVEILYTLDEFQKLLNSKGLTTFDEAVLGRLGITWPLRVEKKDEDQFIANLTQATNNAEKATVTERFLREKTRLQTEQLKDTTKLSVTDIKNTLESASVSKDLAPSVFSESFFTPLFARGYRFAFEGTGVKIERSATEEKDVTELNTLINGYISSGKISLDSLRVGLLYATPDFSNFVTARTDKDGKVLDTGKAELVKYVEILKAKTSRTSVEDAFLTAYGSGSDYTALETSVVAKRAEQNKKVETGVTAAVSDAAKTGKIDTPVGTIDVSSEAAQKHLKNFDGKKFSEDFVKAPVGTTLGLAGDIVKASGSSAPIVLLGFLFLAFKGLTGEIRGVAGWKILLGGLFAHGVAKAFGGPDALAKVIDGVGKGDKNDRTSGGGKKDEGNNSGKDNDASGAKEDEKKSDVLTIPQQALHDRILANPDIKTKVNILVTDEKKKGSVGKTGTLEDYAKFISSTKFQEIDPENLIFNQNHIESVFSLSPSLSAHINLPNNLDPMMFKRVMRTYLTMKDTYTKGTDGKQELGVPEKEAFLQTNSITVEGMKGKKFQDVVNAVHEKIAKTPAKESATTPAVETTTAPGLTVENTPSGLNVTAKISDDKQKVTIDFSKEVIMGQSKIKSLVVANKTANSQIRVDGVDYEMEFDTKKLVFTKK